MQSYGSILGRDQIARKLGGQTYLPRRQVNHAEKAWGLYYEPPQTREHAEELEIYNSIWD